MTDEGFRRQLLGRIGRDASLLTGLQTKIDELQAHLARVDGRLASARALYLAEFGEEPDLGVLPPQEDRDSPLLQEPGPLTGATWEEGITYVLSEAGHPLHVGEIWRRMSETGFATNARDPKRTIVAVALRAGLPRVAANTYGLPLPPSETETGGVGPM
jgi:hypothetical protein